MPQRLISCLGLAIYGMFIAIIIPDTRTNRAVMGVVLAAMFLSTVFTYAPFLKTAVSSGFRIIIITIVVAAVAAIIAPHSDANESGTAGGEG